VATKMAALASAPNCEETYTYIPSLFQPGLRH
jgi:hypothetical protein